MHSSGSCSFVAFLINSSFAIFSEESAKDFLLITKVRIKKINKNLIKCLNIYHYLFKKYYYANLFSIKSKLLSQSFSNL